MLLGTSGSGKSTTLLYLSGLKMKKVRLDGIPHIRPESFSGRSDLVEVGVSPFAKSETRFVRAIKISMDDKSDIIVVDAPGVPDTESAEVDVANSVSIMKALSLANSIRPVFVFSGRNLGGRCEKLKEQIIFYSSMFSA
jgi:ribosome biogenesis GTPase A